MVFLLWSLIDSSFLSNQAIETLGIMGDAIDLTGDGGVIKTIVRRAKADAVAPTENLPLVDGMLNFQVHSLHDLVSTKAFHKVLGNLMT